MSSNLSTMEHSTQSLLWQHGKDCIHEELQHSGRGQSNRKTIQYEAIKYSSAIKNCDLHYWRKFDSSSTSLCPLSDVWRHGSEDNDNSQEQCPPFISSCSLIFPLEYRQIYISWWWDLIYYLQQKNENDFLPIIGFSIVQIFYLLNQIKIGWVTCQSQYSFTELT